MFNREFYKKKPLRWKYNSVYLLLVSIFLYTLVNNTTDIFLTKQSFQYSQAELMLCTCSDNPAAPACSECDDDD